MRVKTKYINSTRGTSSNVDSARALWALLCFRFIFNQVKDCSSPSASCSNSVLLLLLLLLFFVLGECTHQYDETQELINKEIYCFLVFRCVGEYILQALFHFSYLH